MYFIVFRKLRRRKSTRTALEFSFLVLQKFAIYKILNTLKLFLFTIDSCVLIKEEIQFSFMKGSLNIRAHLCMKIILVDPNLMHTSFGKIFFILIMVRSLENNYFLMRTKLGCLQYMLRHVLTSWRLEIFILTRKYCYDWKQSLFKMNACSDSLKLVSTLFINFLFFKQAITLQKLWKMLFISPKTLFSFSRYSNFCISDPPLFSTCWPLP